MAFFNYKTNSKNGIFENAQILVFSPPTRSRVSALKMYLKMAEKGPYRNISFFIEDCAQILRHKKFMHYFTSITYTKSGRKSFLLLDLE